jgi:hypothetical protein
VREDMSDLKRPSIIGPGASSFVMICLLILLSRENAQERPSDIHDMLQVFLLLLMPVSTIWVWQRYLKEYVAFAIEQKLREISKNPEG